MAPPVFVTSTLSDLRDATCRRLGRDAPLAPPPHRSPAGQRRRPSVCSDPTSSAWLQGPCAWRGTTPPPTHANRWEAHPSCVCADGMARGSFRRPPRLARPAVKCPRRGGSCLPDCSSGGGECASPDRGEGWTVCTVQNKSTWVLKISVLLRSSSGVVEGARAEKPD